MLMNENITRINAIHKSATPGHVRYEAGGWKGGDGRQGNWRRGPEEERALRAERSQEAAAMRRLKKKMKTGARKGEGREVPAGWTRKAGGLLGVKVRPSHSPPPSPCPGGQAAAGRPRGGAGS